MKIKDYVDEKENRGIAEARFLAAYNLKQIDSIFKKVNFKKARSKEVNYEKEH